MAVKAFFPALQLLQKCGFRIYEKINPEAKMKRLRKGRTGAVQLIGTFAGSEPTRGRIFSTAKETRKVGPSA